MGAIVLFLRQRVLYLFLIMCFLFCSITNEAGASIYSVSPEACKEMPNLDPNLRSAGNYWLLSYPYGNQNACVCCSHLNK